MGLSARLAESSGIRVTRKGSLELISYNDVEEFLDAAAHHGAIVLGIEGFRLVNDRTVPDMRALADFSNLASEPMSARTSVEQALLFVRKVGTPEMCFEFVLSDTKA